MKLRNKKTGEIIENACIGVFKHKSSGDCERVDTEARSLEKVLEEWEDYKPTEPLIKDEKVRKAVRAWAEANGIERVWHEYSSCWLRGNGLEIELKNEVVDLEQNNYTIDELCGEEE